MKFSKKNIIQKTIIIAISLFIFIVVFNYAIMPWYVYSSEVTVPKVTGKSMEDAMSVLEEAGLNPIIGDTSYDNKTPKGYILIQRPKSGEKVKEGRRIYLFVSGGKPVISVPKLVGKTVTNSRFSLERLGLKLGSIFEAPSNSPKNTVLEQQYSEGTKIDRGSAVNITVSSGSETGSIVVPDLIGKSLTDAEAIITELNLKIGKINYQPSFAILPNTIIDQYPSKGVLLNPSDNIDLFITKNVEINDEIGEEPK